MNAGGKKLYKVGGIWYILERFGALKVGYPNSPFTTKYGGKHEKH
jgi:hypothetical protein